MKFCPKCQFTWSSKDESCPVCTLVDHAMSIRKPSAENAFQTAGHTVKPVPLKQPDGTWLINFNLKRENTFNWNIQFPIKCTTHEQAVTIIRQIACEILGNMTPDEAAAGSCP